MTARSVVHVVRSDAFAGVERYVAETASELANRGWHVRVIGGDAAAMPAHLDSGVEFRAATTTAQVFRALRAVGTCDIVHAHMTAAELPAALLKRRLGARLVVTRHFAAPRGASVPGRAAARVIEKRMDLQLAISRFVADATSSPCVVLPNGVRPSDAAEPRAPVVVVLQRFEPEKDTGTAVRAWAAAGLGALGWRLVLHGRGSEEHSLRALASALGIDDSVTFAGFTDDARSALRRGALMLAPATAEPFGLAVVEAMAEATPVIATRSGAHPETLGDDGAYFAPGDVAGCAAQLTRLAAAEDERRAIGARLRQRQQRSFAIAGHVDRLEAHYLEQLDRIADGARVDGR